MSDQADSNVITLVSSGLLSKWGFNDGDVPDAFLDYLDDRGVPYPEDWHRLLRLLVHRYLVPVLDQHVELVDVETNHNPIRAATVDGVDVDWYGDRPNPSLTPECTTVSFEDVLALDTPSEPIE